MEAIDNQSQEEWREIPGFPGYEISDHGRLRSFLSGKIRIKSFVVDSGGYHSTLLRQNGKSKHVRAHNLVALAFIGPPPPDSDIHHIDHNKINNCRDNLTYVKTTIHVPHHSGIFSKAEKQEIRHLFMNHVDDLDELAALIGVCKSTIRKCVCDLID